MFPFRKCSQKTAARTPLVRADKRQAKRARLCVETLEDRVTPATVVYTPGAALFTIDIQQGETVTVAVSDELDGNTISGQNTTLGASALITDNSLTGADGFTYTAAATAVGNDNWLIKSGPSNHYTVHMRIHPADNGGEETQYELSVYKFIDINGDGVNNGGDGPVAGITINVWVDANSNGVNDLGDLNLAQETGPDGFAEFVITAAGPVSVTEDFSSSAFEWKMVSSSNTAFIGVLGQNQTTTFGNILCDAGLAKTIGYWANNAAKTFTDIAGLNNGLAQGGVTAQLFNAATDNQFSSFAEFRTWILGASAKNMEYMLSAQLAAAALNVGSGMASAYTLVTITDAQVAALGLTAGTDYTVVNGKNVIQIKDVIALANAALGTSASKDYLGALKTILDGFNNMTNWYVSDLCAC